MATAQEILKSNEHMEAHGERTVSVMRRIQTIKADVDILEEDGTPEKRYLGSLWAASGPRTSRYSLENLPNEPGWLLDWALGKIDPRKRDISDNIPNFWANKFNPPIRLPKNGIADQYQSHSLKQEVAKHGRTTGWTTGVLNAAVAFVKPDTKADVNNKHEQSDNHIDDCEPGIDKQPNDLISTCEFVPCSEMVDKYGAVCRAVSFIRDGKSQMMQPGGSGSIV